MRKITLVVAMLLMAVSVQASPWPVRAAKVFGKQYVSMIKDCTHKWDFALQCIAVYGSAAFDFQTTSSAINHGFSEGNPLIYGVIGRRPSAHKLAIYAFVTSSLEMTGIDYLYNNRNVRPRGPWDLLGTGEFTGLHIWAGIHNNNLVANCQKAHLICR